MRYNIYDRSDGDWYFYDQDFSGEVKYHEELEVELAEEAERYYNLGEELKFKASRTYRPESNYSSPKCWRCGGDLNDATTGDRLGGPECAQCGQSIHSFVIPEPKGKKLSKEELEDLLNEIKKQESTFKLD